jgi:hypothetical protein
MKDQILDKTALVDIAVVVVVDVFEIFYYESLHEMLPPKRSIIERKLRRIQESTSFSSYS